MPTSIHARKEANKIIVVKGDSTVYNVFYLSKKKYITRGTGKLWSANAINLDKAEILSNGKE